VLAVALAAGCAAAWTGCGRGSGSSGGAVAIDACKLLTPEDVRAVAPDAAGSLSSTLDDAVGRDPSQCAYPVGSTTPPRVVSLALRRLPSAEAAADYQRRAESGLRSLASGAVEEEPGLGDGAFWVGGQLDQLHVARGDTILVFTVQIDEQPLAAARRLADLALARLAARRPPGGAAQAPQAPPRTAPPAPAPPAAGTAGTPPHTVRSIRR
jgi:hypothetical protein